jgi:hypothetical protein
MEISSELVELKTVVKIRRQDLREANDKLKEKAEETLTRLNELRKSNLPSAEIAERSLQMLTELVDDLVFLNKAVIKYIEAQENLISWYKKGADG